MSKKIQVVVAMGSKSDLKCMSEAVAILKELGISTRVEILSAHRTPELLKMRPKRWEEEGVSVVIAGAGGAAHLPGMLASFTHLPVIGVPVIVGRLGGLDALLSIAQMPAGVPVATVAIGNARNAGLLAARIIGVFPTVEGTRVAAKLRRFRKSLTAKVLKDRNTLLKKKLTALI